MEAPSRRQFLAAGAALAAQIAAADSSADLTLKQASDAVRAKKISPLDLTEQCLDRIKTYNPKINAWITVMREKALEQAKALAEEQSAGHIRGPLHGIPIGIKDTIDIANVRTTAASAVYEYRFAGEDSEAVRRLRAAGAILIGKCNLHEFDAGATSSVSYWGPVRNPWNLDRIAGGPSGGSAAAVAMQNCFAALGTDAAGGIRVPAAYCGIVGFKPTYGRVSMRGIVPMAWSLDHCGPIARTVEDAALILQAIAGYDYQDIDCVDRPVPDYSAGIGAPVAQFRLGMPAEFFDHLDDEIAKAIDDAITILNKLTKGTHEVGLPSLLHSGVNAEIIAAHENVRGVNGGVFEPSTTRVFAASPDSARAVDFIRGWRDLEIVRRTVDEDVFHKQNVDLLIAPATRHMPPTIEQDLVPAPAAGGRGGANAVAAAGGRGAAEGGTEGRGNAPAASRKPDLESTTRAFNGYGLPIITLPCGFSKDGMPIGLQIAGPHFTEAQVLALAYAYQQATDWHLRRPPLTPDTKVPVLSKLAAEQTGS